jgi:hypothetical protein
MKALANEDTFSGHGADRLFVAEASSGTVVLQFKKTDGSFATIETFSTDLIKTLPTTQGLLYRVLLTGAAKALIAT